MKTLGPILFETSVDLCSLRQVVALPRPMISENDDPMYDDDEEPQPVNVLLTIESVNNQPFEMGVVKEGKKSQMVKMSKGSFEGVVKFEPTVVQKKVVLKSMKPNKVNIKMKKLKTTKSVNSSENDDVNNEGKVVFGKQQQRRIGVLSSTKSSHISGSKIDSKKKIPEFASADINRILVPTKKFSSSTDDESSLAKSSFSADLANSSSSSFSADLANNSSSLSSSSSTDLANNNNSSSSPMNIQREQGKEEILAKEQEEILAKEQQQYEQKDEQQQQQNEKEQQQKQDQKNDKEQQLLAEKQQVQNLAFSKTLSNQKNTIGPSLSKNSNFASPYSLGVVSHPVTPVVGFPLGKKNDLAKNDLSKNDSARNAKTVTLSNVERITEEERHLRIMKAMKKSSNQFLSPSIAHSSRNLLSKNSLSQKSSSQKSLAKSSMAKTSFSADASAAAAASLSFGSSLAKTSVAKTSPYSNVKRPTVDLSLVSPKTKLYQRSSKSKGMFREPLKLQQNPLQSSLKNSVVSFMEPKNNNFLENNNSANYSSKNENSELIPKRGGAGDNKNRTPHLFQTVENDKKEGKRDNENDLSSSCKVDYCEDENGVVVKKVRAGKEGEGLGGLGELGGHGSSSSSSSSGWKSSDILSSSKSFREPLFPSVSGFDSSESRSQKFPSAESSIQEWNTTPSAHHQQQQQQQARLPHDQMSNVQLLAPSSMNGNRPTTNFPRNPESYFPNQTRMFMQNGSTTTTTTTTQNILNAHPQLGHVQNQQQQQEQQQQQQQQQHQQQQQQRNQFAEMQKTNMSNASLKKFNPNNYHHYSSSSSFFPQMMPSLQPTQNFSPRHLNNNLHSNNNNNQFPNGMNQQQQPMSMFHPSTNSVVDSPKDISSFQNASFESAQIVKNENESKKDDDVVKTVKKSSLISKLADKIKSALKSRFIKMFLLLSVVCGAFWFFKLRKKKRLSKLDKSHVAECMEKKGRGGGRGERRVSLEDKMSDVSNWKNRNEMRDGNENFDEELSNLDREYGESSKYSGHRHGRHHRQRRHRRHLREQRNGERSNEMEKKSRNRDYNDDDEEEFSAKEEEGAEEGEFNNVENIDNDNKNNDQRQEMKDMNKREQSSDQGLYNLKKQQFLSNKHSSSLPNSTKSAKTFSSSSYSPSYFVQDSKKTLKSNDEKNNSYKNSSRHHNQYEVYHSRSHPNTIIQNGNGFSEIEKMTTQTTRSTTVPSSQSAKSAKKTAESSNLPVKNSSSPLRSVSVPQSSIDNSSLASSPSSAISSSLASSSSSESSSLPPTSALPAAEESNWTGPFEGSIDIDSPNFFMTHDPIYEILNNKFVL